MDQVSLGHPEVLPARAGQNLRVQTFLPYPDLRASSVVLDDRRLGKQRVETFQILRALTFETYAWRNHPAVRMWRGFVPGLVRYGRENCREWVRRGYADTLADKFLEWSDGVEPDDPPLPPWFGWEPLHRSHRFALLRKEPEWYAARFPAEAAADPEDDDGYLWPPDVFPAWPVRGDGLAVPTAFRALGIDEPRPAQTAAAEAAAAGRDVLLVMRPGTGGSTAGLAAGLATKGLTWWVHPPFLPRSPAVPAVVGPPPRDVPPGEPAPLTARPPGPADLVAMRAEAQPPEFLFTPADGIAGGPSEHPIGLVVVDGAHRLTAEQAQQTAAVRRRLGDPPLLVIVPRADPAEREAIVAAHGLTDPLHAGGGWDPGSALSIRRVSSARARGGAVSALVAERKPALVVCPTREAARRRAERLSADGLPAQVWSPPPMRPSRAEAALGAFRSRRLAALVVSVDALPPLPRARLALLISENPPSLESWRAEIETARAEVSVAVLDPDADPDLLRLADAGPELRAALLDHFGEPG